MIDYRKRAEAIALVIFDVDGVLTDGSLYLGDDGQEYKAFNSRDGHGMTMLREAGIELAVITGRRSEVVRIRMESLGIEHIFQGRRDKLPAYESLRTASGLADSQIAYVGDDVVDLPVMRHVGLAIAVADAHPLVKAHCHWQTQTPGGHGAAREVCEGLLEAQGKLGGLFARYLGA
ncbi:3-deoxy-manno-octulosonate-8-phosphatase KdsC [Halochromatium glycolicum]|uniref:3-deoxy-D-manno-octulosonate 8-phosphate phosphatase KdsC n=1 Tax=Halochromatium glycolicum TaxID=85075 RepID=A0AAJ0U7K2_9GAMM|nr:3-deoxy-manno-octulosonate-8-phosphatase KdsC [Halochromatium glycolicum]MBK1706769.1 3-deoxy-D-manno-octulosonate 8-phosphate phosphatase [Halochromatium glycolicum]